jgi:hypothetical protein
MAKDKEPKRRDRLAREGEPSQRTEEGLEIPVPERDEVLGALGKAIRKRPSEPQPRGKRRSSQGQ